MPREEALPPNFQKLETALRSIGYTFEAAVADIIDNSIDARAKTIAVRLVTNSAGHLDLAIWDDGHGMGESTLREAMRFGSDVSGELDRLGKFGLGLKLASLSQARELKVVSAKDGRLSGRAWSEDGITKGFSSTVYDARECRTLVAALFPDRKFKPSATMICWSRLYRVGHHHGGAQEQAQKLLRRLEVYLSLAFHRFISGRARRVRMLADILDRTSGKVGIPKELDAMDPFGYEVSGQLDFPAKLQLGGAYKNRFPVVAHIWPPNSSSPAYRLPGGANARQGFYFYRNQRLIQGGGWNGIREVEPHASLARIEIDLPPEFDVELSLDVKKVEIQLPHAFAVALQKSQTKQGIDFKRYLALAQNVYRKRKPTSAELPLIPSAGLPAPLGRFLHNELRHESTTKHHDLSIAWKPLGRETFFELDRETGHLYLNSGFRRQLLHGLPSSATDAPVLKCLLFLVLEGALTSERMSSRSRERVEFVNRFLVQAVKHERRPA